ncbi:YidH family protein [Rothia aerolata]|uniref:Membrane protein n=1 Tax=Rothia aerolata TaxID=1812262 RepID=A0A917IYA4_9MICC|nr:DUF202 domain-containing protein [Rothia aerolata]GGH66227.1 membrane protein [Rothia aerolata]
MSKDDRDWLSRKLFREGTEPDPRFTLANERTFLAWIRTSLAFLAGGIAAYAFEGMPGIDGERWHIIAFLMPILACILTVFAVFRWIRVERSMRVGKPLPSPAGLPLIVLIVAVSSAIVVSLSVV